jgi:hypothetical protein
VTASSYLDFTDAGRLAAVLVIVFAVWLLSGWK